MDYDPARNIWRAEDGRLWSSLRLGPVTASDPDVVAWLAAGGVFSTWPRDEAGAQTQAALNAVLSFYGILPDLAAYAAARRFVCETGGIVVGGERIKTDRESQSLIAGAHALALTEPDEPVEFKGASGWVQIDSAGMILIGLAVARHVRDCFRRESAVVAAIAAGTVTTRAQIDAAFAA